MGDSEGESRNGAEFVLSVKEGDPAAVYLPQKDDAAEVFGVVREESGKTEGEGSESMDGSRNGASKKLVGTMFLCEPSTENERIMSTYETQRNIWSDEGQLYIRHKEKEVNELKKKLLKFEKKNIKLRNQLAMGGVADRHFVCFFLHQLGFLSPPALKVGIQDFYQYTTLIADYFADFQPWYSSVDVPRVLYLVLLYVCNLRRSVESLLHYVEMTLGDSISEKKLIGEGLQKYIEKCTLSPPNCMPSFCPAQLPPIPTKKTEKNLEKPPPQECEKTQKCDPQGDGSQISSAIKGMWNSITRILPDSEISPHGLPPTEEQKPPTNVTPQTATSSSSAKGETLLFSNGDLSENIRTKQTNKEQKTTQSNISKENTNLKPKDISQLEKMCTQFRDTQPISFEHLRNLWLHSNPSKFKQENSVGKSEEVSDLYKKIEILEKSIQNLNTKNNQLIQQNGQFIVQNLRNNQHALSDQKHTLHDATTQTTEFEDQVQKLQKSLTLSSSLEQDLADEVKSLRTKMEEIRLASESNKIKMAKSLQHREDELSRVTSELAALETQMMSESVLRDLIDGRAEKETKILNLNSALSESQALTNLQDVQIQDLKKQIRQLSAAKEETNLSYLKNVLFRYLEYSRKGDHANAVTVLPVISTILRLSPQEQDILLGKLR